MWWSSLRPLYTSMWWSPLRPLYINVVKSPQATLYTNELKSPQATLYIIMLKFPQSPVLISVIKLPQTLGYLNLFLCWSPLKCTVHVHVSNALRQLQYVLALGHWGNLMHWDIDASNVPRELQDLVVFRALRELQHIDVSNAPRKF